jgi:PAS domain S-box
METSGENRSRAAAEGRPGPEEPRTHGESLASQGMPGGELLAFSGGALDSAADGIAITDATGRLTRFNDQFVRMWNLSRELVVAGEPEAIRQRVAGQVPDPAAFVARVVEIHEKSPDETFDILRLVDGRVIERVSKVERVDANVVGRVWSFRDVTDRRAVEMKLREQREWFEVTLSSIGDAVITTDVEGRVTFMNPVAEQMTGWKVPEAKGRPLEEVFNIVSEETGERASNPVGKVLAVGTVIGLANHTALVDRKGEMKAIEDSAAPIRDGTGKITGVVIVFQDVTERRRADEARLRLAAVVESSEDAILTKTLDGIISSWNEGARRMFGYTAEEAIGKPVTILMPADFVNEEPAILERLRRGERIEHYETVRRRKDGTLMDISLTVSPIRDSNGRIVGGSKIARDITERKRAEAALQRSAEAFRQLADSMPQIVWTARADGTIDYFNRRWYEFTGTEPKEGDPAWDRMVHPEDMPRCLTLWEESVRTGQPYQIEYRFRNQAGEYRWHLGRAVAVRNAAGEMVRWYGSATDIHEQRLTAEALREEYLVVEQLNAVSRALATELDLRKVVQIVTDAATRITRAQFGAFVFNRPEGQGDAYTLYTQGGAAEATFEAFSVSRSSPLFEEMFDGVVRLADVRKDPKGRGEELRAVVRRERPVASYLALPVRSRGGEVLGGLFFGHELAGVFTERDERMMVAMAAQAAAAMDTARLYEAELHARNAAEQANQAKDHFLAALSHELRTPLTPVLAILTSLTEDPTIPAALAKDLRTMRRNVELESRLIDDLLDLTRITRGKLELQRDRVSLGQLLENALATCRPEIEARRLRLVREVAEERQVVVVDEARITQVLWNLLKNAVKFTPEGGTITVRTRVVNAADGRFACIQIQDTGIGIEPDRLGKIFEAFEQGDRSVTQRFGGLGLGLAISKAIAELHQGSVTAESGGAGRGSTFTLRLPCSPCDEPSGEAPTKGEGGKAAEKPRETAAVAARRARLLLVEDHVDTATVLARMLGRSGYEVFRAGTVSEALAIVERELKGAGLHLVISDLGLPDGSGLDMMRELSSRHGLRGIALSGYGMEGDREQSAAAGFARHLTKPVNVSVLRATIAELVGEMGD